MLEFTVEGCQGQATIQMNLLIHFVQHNMWDTVVILEEGNRPPPTLTRVQHFSPWKSLNVHHPTMDLCASRADRKHNRLAAEES